jgi:uncharacterized membrane protein
MTKTIGNPGSWIVDEARIVGSHIGAVTDRLGSHELGEMPQVRRIEISDLREVLRKGAEDFAACRSDVAFLCVFYPMVGMILAWIAFDRNLAPLLFPAMSGFALLGPVAAVGLYEMSRKRELGEETGWADAFAVLKSPSFGAIFALGLVLMGVFVVWLAVAGGIYSVTLGPEPPASIGSFLRDTLTTGAGWAMVLIGFAVGFLFAVLVLVFSVVSFPLLLDRRVGIPIALTTSMRVVAANPGPIAAWGLIVAVALAIGSVPLFLGLIVVLPILGHATWHLYRKTVVAGPHDA